MTTRRWETELANSEFIRGRVIAYRQTDKTIIVILCGGDKSTQDKDIKRAKDVAAGL